MRELLGAEEKPDCEECDQERVTEGFALLEKCGSFGVAEVGEMLWGLGAPGHGEGKAERWECSDVLPEDGPGGRWVVVECSSGRAGPSLQDGEEASPRPRDEGLWMIRR